MKALPTILAALVAVAPLPALARHPAPPEGVVVVFNASGTSVTVSLYGSPSMRLASGQTATLHGPVGPTTLKATYTQFGATRVLETERVHLARGRKTTVVLEPEDSARVQVTNTTDEVGELRIDGRSYGSFQPGQARILTVPAGTASLTFLVGGRAQDEARLELRPYAEPTWLVEAPRHGDLLVQNPLPIAVELVCSRGMVRTVPAFGAVTYDDLPRGPFSVTARRVTDETIDRATVEIRGGHTTVWTVDPPTRGLLAVDSEHWTNARIYVDGAFTRLATPGSDSLLNVAVGRHHLTVRDERDRALLDAWVEVGPYDVARMEFGSERHVMADAGHGGGDDRHHDIDDHDGHAHAAGASCGMPD